MAANDELARIFAQMANVMQILEEDRFRVIAFQKVARVLDDASQDVGAIGPNVPALMELPGVGKGMAERIAEFLKTGKIAEHQALMARVPPGLMGLLDIQGMGPKTVALLWNSAGVDSIEALKEKLKGDELASLPGMGAKKIENLRKSVSFVDSSAGRVRIGQAMPLALWFVEKVRKMPGVKQVSYAGSLRRGRETIGDIDIVAAAPAKDVPAITGAFVKLEPVTDVLGRGETKASVRTNAGMQVDLRVVEPGVFGATLLYFTGSKDHNIRMREMAIKQGLKLSEYGLFRGDDPKPVAAATEEDVYKALGMIWIPPELREDQGELDAARENKLPTLLTIDDIHAELHSHTTASDGKWSIRELASIAVDRGFHTLAITDHSKSQPIANGLSEERLEQHIVAVRAVAAEMKGKLRLLAGSEVDILADGTMDYPNSLLKELDIVVASPHNALTQDSTTATKRLLKAIHNPYVTFIAHPTGRLVLKRDGLHPDMKELFKAAAQRGIALEINANSYRLDLRDAHARAALEAGVKLVINTDAHGPGDMEQLAYGVLTARRAGATANDVVNCLSREKLGEWIKSTRK